MAYRDHNSKPPFIGTRIHGPHYVIPRNGLKLYSVTARRDGVRCNTLTQARRVAGRGDCIVRQDDGVVVSVKGGTARESVVTAGKEVA